MHRSDQHKRREPDHRREEVGPVGNRVPYPHPFGTVPMTKATTIARLAMRPSLIHSRSAGIGGEVTPRRSGAQTARDPPNGWDPVERVPDRARRCLVKER